MTDRSKWFFWGGLLLGFIVLAIPSTMLLEAITRYRSFISGFEPAPIRQTATSFPIEESSSRGLQDHLPRIRFIKFKLRAPNAKSVCLIGEFNAWKAGSFPLVKKSRGEWEAILPLPAGTYHYLFLVDGKPSIDPANRNSETISGRKTSVKHVR